MRTVKIRHEIDMGQGQRLVLETEVILGSDEEAREAGTAAARVLDEIKHGLAEAE